MNTRRATVSLAVVMSLAVAGCGGSDEKQESEAGSTPAQAVVEIGNVREALDAGVAALAGGDREKADETIAEGYVEHFEKVEGPLEKVDHELKEQLEGTIATKIRGRIKDGAPVDEVRKLVEDAKADLATAEAKLKQS
jgi:DNA anti-recombination protein RmuC